ncbi:AAA family ATPase [Flavobacteriales bacterium]|nr:AAA family ATPase [Flavobacteriales bacterium]
MSTKITDLQGDLLRNFPHQATAGQIQWIHQVAGFLLERDPHQMFVLKGYAGTGKTSLLQSLIPSLTKYNRKAVLLAPTGRAAKVMSAYTKRKAYTIHKHIYYPKLKSGSLSFELQKNKASNTIYIVDEASMIGNQTDSAFGGNALLDDLIRFADQGLNCKVLLIGDVAQLPPVGLSLSPALIPEELKLRYFKEVFHVELQEVVRQAESSGILKNATSLRSLLESNDDRFKPTFNLYPDVNRIVEKQDLEDALNTAYSSMSIEDSVVVLRSNKRANVYNQQIRNRILWYEDEITSGDHLMVVKNNYFCLPKESKAGFIANGDQIVVKRIITTEERHGFRFAKAEVNLIDYPDEPEFESYLLLDCIYVDRPSMSYEDGNRLYKSIERDYAHIKTKYKRFQAIKTDPYFNALQVKFAYAITCHKAQGGQWKNVFIEQGYLPEDTVDKEYLRWLYTAFTRAVNTVYLIGFKPDFFDEEVNQ